MQIFKLLLILLMAFWNLNPAKKKSALRDATSSVALEAVPEIQKKQLRPIITNVVPLFYTTSDESGQELISYGIKKVTDIPLKGPGQDRYSFIWTTSEHQDLAMLVKIALEENKLQVIKKVGQDKEDKDSKDQLKYSLETFGTIFEQGFTDQKERLIFWVVPEEFELVERANYAVKTQSKISVYKINLDSKSIPGASIKRKFYPEPNQLIDFHYKLAEESQFQKLLEKIKKTPSKNPLKQEVRLNGTIILPIAQQQFTKDLWTILGQYNSTKDPLQTDQFTDPEFTFFTSVKKIPVSAHEQSLTAQKKAQKMAPSKIRTKIHDAARTVISNKVGNALDETFLSKEFSEMKDFMVAALSLENGLEIDKDSDIGNKLYLKRGTTKDSPDIILWRIDRERSFKFLDHKKYMRTSWIGQNQLNRFASQAEDRSGFELTPSYEGLTQDDPIITLEISKASAQKVTQSLMLKATKKDSQILVPVQTSLDTLQEIFIKAYPTENFYTKPDSTNALEAMEKYQALEQIRPSIANPLLDKANKITLKALKQDGYSEQTKKSSDDLYQRTTNPPDLYSVGTQAETWDAQHS